MITTFSHSSLNSFRRCPRKFAYEKIEKIQVPEVITPDTYLGTAVHRVLQKLYKFGADDVLLSLEDTLADYHSFWDKINLDILRVESEHYTVDDYIRIGEKMLRRHYEKYQPFNSGTLLGVELYLSFELPGTPFKVQGFIDKLWRREDGIVEICDYKTGMTIARPQDETFRWQMGIYELAVRASWPQYEDIEVAQHFLRHDEIIRHRNTPEQLDILTEEIRNEIMEIYQANKTQNFPATENSLCRYCDYQQYCPSRRHARMLEEESDEPEPSPESKAQQLRSMADRYLELHKVAGTTKAEMDALKEEFKQIVREGGPTKLIGELGHVNVKLGTIEKFITKTRDAQQFAELSATARRLKLDEFFDLNGRALFKHYSISGRLSDEQKQALAPFVIEEEDSRVTARPNKVNDDKDDQT